MLFMLLEEFVTTMEEELFLSMEVLSLPEESVVSVDEELSSFEDERMASPSGDEPLSSLQSCYTQDCKK